MPRKALPKGQTTDPRNGAPLILFSPPEEAPPVPEGIATGYAINAWAAFWRSPVSAVVTEADHPALRRWIELVDLREQMLGVAREEPMVSGSTGQKRAHPFWGEVRSLESDISKLEAQFGMTPASRMKLGVSLGQARKSLAEMNAEIMKANDEDARYEIIEWTED